MSMINDFSNLQMNHDIDKKNDYNATDEHKTNLLDPSIDSE